MNETNKKGTFNVPFETSPPWWAPHRNLIGFCSMLSTQSASGPKNFSSYIAKLELRRKIIKKLLIYANIQHEIIAY